MNPVELSKPIEVHGEQVETLELREPTTEDVMQLGVPQLLIPSADGESVGVEVRTKVVGQYIVRLAKIPMSSVKQLTIRDFNACTGVVMGFFNGGDD